MNRTTNYSSEFKREAVKLSLSSDKPIAHIANELGINESTLYNWRSKFMKEQKPLTKDKGFR